MLVLADIEYNCCLLNLLGNQFLYMRSHVEKAGNGEVEMVIGSENESKKPSISIVPCFLHRLMSSVLCHYSFIPSIGYMTGFMSPVLCLYSCTVFCDYLFSVID